MKSFIKSLTFLFVTLFTTLAFALATPQEIENDIAGHNYAQARAKVEQVLVEKPNSARAHLLKAFLLVHVDKNVQQAAHEIKQVELYDTKGDVKSSPLFARVVGEMSATKSVVVTKPASTPDHTDEIIMAVVIIFIAVFLFLMVKAERRIIEARYTPPNDYERTSNGFYTTNRPISTPSYEYRSGSPVMNTTNRPISTPSYEYRSGSPVMNTTYQPVQPNTGIGVLGTAAAVAGGVVAGELIHDALTSEIHSKRKTVDENLDDSRSSYTPSYEEERYTSSSSSSSWDSDSSSSYSSSSDSSWSSDSGSSDW